MLIHFVSGTGKAGITHISDVVSNVPPPIPGQIDNMLLQLNIDYQGSTQTLKLSFRETYSKISFWYSWADYPVAFRAVDSNNNTLDTQIGPATPKDTAIEMTFSHNDIAGIYVTAGQTGPFYKDWIVLDWFRFTR